MVIKFIRKVLVYAVALVALFEILYYLFPNSILDRSYPIYKYQIESTESPVDEKIMFIGASRVVASINPLLIPNSRNAGLVKSNPMEGYYLLKRYFDNEKNDIETIFISYGWPVLNEYSPDVLIERGGFFDFYSFEEYDEIIETAKKVDPDFLDEFGENEFLLAKWKSPHYIGTKIKSRLFMGSIDNSKTYSQLVKNKGHITGIWGDTIQNKVPEEARLDSLIVKPIYAYYMNKLIELCNSNNATVIYEGVPFNQSSQVVMKTSLKQSYSNYITSLDLKFPGNIFNDTVYFLPDYYFADLHHMNKEGAKHYTEYLKKKYFTKK